VRSCRQRPKAMQENQLSAGGSERTFLGGAAAGCTAGAAARVWGLCEEPAALPLAPADGTACGQCAHSGYDTESAWPNTANT
jgi:hypothetical protein